MNRKVIRLVIVLSLFIAVGCSTKIIRTSEIFTGTKEKLLFLVKEKDGNKYKDSIYIFTQNNDAENPMKISMPEAVKYPCLSPNGQELIFIQEPISKWEKGEQEAPRIGRYNLAKKDFSFISEPGEYEYPSFSPDGQQIVTVLRDRSSDPEYLLNIIDRNGKNKSIIISLPLNARYPSWSPNGKEIVFIGESTYENEVDKRGIYTVNSDGKNLQRVKNVKDIYKLFYYDKISKEGQKTREQGELYKFIVYCPKFSPDGAKISFTDTANGSIYIINRDGSDLKRIYRNKKYVIWHYDWANNGKSIVFAPLLRDYKKWYPEQLEQIDINGKNHSVIFKKAALYPDYPQWCKDK